jgi:hypothetical protein
MERTAADRLLLSALREPGQQKGGAFRHWLMWAAASVFGTMRSLFGLPGRPRDPRFRDLGPAGHCAPLDVARAVAGQLDAALPHGRGDPALPGRDGELVAGGANITAGWLPTALMAAPVVILLGIAWSGEVELDQGVAFWLLLGVLALVLLGHLWGLAVDRTLRWRLWPTSLVGLPIATIPVGLIFLSIVLVWFVDLGASIAASFS